jgi:hypothetical protein
LRKPYHTGETEVVLEPVALLRRLAALVPPKRQNQIRYYGLLAAQAHDRDRLVALVPNAQDLAGGGVGRGLETRDVGMAPIRRPVPTRPRRQPAPTIAFAGQSFWPAYSGATCCCAATAASAQM